MTLYFLLKTIHGLLAAVLLGAVLVGLFFAHRAWKGGDLQQIALTFSSLVDNPASARMLDACYAAAGMTGSVYIDVDNGMHRTGFPAIGLFHRHDRVGPGGHRGTGHDPVCGSR